MKVEDFIKELQKYPNQKDELNFIVSVRNSEDDTYLKMIIRKNK